MPETAESHAVALTTNRFCVMEVTNLSSVYCLWKPKVHMESGFAFSPPTPTLRTNVTEVFSFTKDDNTASGAVGILTYEMFNMKQRSCTELMAVMFSVPFDYNFYKNWLGVGIFDKSQPCDKSLFKRMYNDNQDSFVRHEANGSGVKFQGKTVDVRATMSDEGRAFIKMELYDRMG
ncbi:bryoporin-like [Acanthopagrus latus]|uniref:bryoporin-like n=1 Tax=Acanthopagrus latus TaxID=8177 RepID=UPI00187BDB56|nr:bryoporin-like [Acanthopagrus latus]